MNNTLYLASLKYQVSMTCLSVSVNLLLRRHDHSRERQRTSYIWRDGQRCKSRLSSAVVSHTSSKETDAFIDCFSGVSRVEKYRPTLLDDIVGNSETVDRLKVIARDGNCPHIVLSVRSQLESLGSKERKLTPDFCRARLVLERLHLYYV